MALEPNNDPNNNQNVLHTEAPVQSPPFITPAPMQVPDKSSEPKRLLIRMFVIAGIVFVAAPLLWVIVMMALFFQVFTPAPKLTDGVKSQVLNTMESRYEEKFQITGTSMQWNENGDHGFDMRFKSTSSDIEYRLMAQVYGDKVTEIEENYGCEKLENEIAARYKPDIDKIIGPDYKYMRLFMPNRIETIVFRAVIKRSRMPIAT